MKLADTWSDERAARVAQQVQRKMTQRRRLGTAMKAVAVAAIVGAALTAALLEKPKSGLTLADGSTATPLSGATQLVVLSDALVRLDRGSARFEVTKNAERTFRVEAAPVTVEVVGTRFVVERLPDSARVSVEEGQVRVLVAGEQTLLSAGQSGLFAARVEETALPQPLPPPPPKPAPPTDWRPSAERGDFDRAYALLEHATPGDDPQELLLASDVARLSGHPKQARAHLLRLLERHPKDARAPLAAFTLGRVLLDQLGWPRDAAEAFAKAKALDPDGPLAEDAMAREVEAWSRAGDATNARAAAERYLASHPNGTRASAVRRYGGL